MTCAPSVDGAFGAVIDYDCCAGAQPILYGHAGSADGLTWTADVTGQLAAPPLVVAHAAAGCVAFGAGAVLGGPARIPLHDTVRRAMQLRPEAIRFTLGQGLPAVIEVAGGSMSPSLVVGDKVRVEPLAPDGPLVPGDVVLIAPEDGSALLIHRVMHAFVEDGRPMIVHQGDAPSSTFGICARDAVIGRAVTLVADPPRGLPAPSHARFQARRRACRAYCGARLLLRVMGLAERPLTRRLARLYRALARALAG
jgi:hypothetical protein